VRNERKRYTRAVDTGETESETVGVGVERAPMPYDPNDHDARVDASETYPWEDCGDDDDEQD
jgi:hypothetical protein